MQFAKPILLSGILSVALVSSACNSLPPVTGCSEFARSILTTKTPHAVMGETGDSEQDWREYGLAETGQLNKSNDDKATGFRIINACEVRDAEVMARINRPWWRLW